MKNEPPDSAEIDSLKELQRSPGYSLLVGRINAEMERKRDQLEDLCTQQLTDYTRGYLKALRTVLGIPQILIDEISKEQ
jgi:hypothetical protein